MAEIRQYHLEGERWCLSGPAVVRVGGGVAEVGVDVSGKRPGSLVGKTKYCLCWGSLCTLCGTYVSGNSLSVNVCA